MTILPRRQSTSVRVLVGWAGAVRFWMTHLAVIDQVVRSFPFGLAP